MSYAEEKGIGSHKKLLTYTLHIIHYREKYDSRPDAGGVHAGSSRRPPIDFGRRGQERRQEQSDEVTSSKHNE